MPTVKEAKAKRDAVHKPTKPLTKGKTKHALPNIETKPSRASAIRTPAEQEALEAREAKRDAQPVAADRSEGKGKSVKGAASDVTKGVQRTFRKTPQKALVAELLAAVFLTAVREVADGNSPGIEPFVGSFVVYLVLGFAAELGGENTARVAAAIGGLVLLAIAARTIGPLVSAGKVVASPQVAPIAGPGSGVRTMGPRGGVHRRPPGRKVRGNNLSNPTG